MEKINVVVTWGFSRQFVEPSYKSYEVPWLREKTMRQLLAHVVGMADERLSLDNAELITLHVAEHADDVTAIGGKRKQTLGKTNATNLRDGVVYTIILYCSTMDFLFHVDLVKVVVQPCEVTHAFTVLRKTHFLRTLVLPPPRDTVNTTANDILHNDVRLRLERKGVGWSMIDVKS